MTMTSWPYVAQDTTDIEYGRLFREMAGSDGMAGSFGDNVLKVTADGSGMTVSVAVGSAILRGYMFYSNAIESVPIAAPSAAARVDLIVLELNLSAPTIATRIILKAIPGVSGSSTPPSLVQSDTGTYQIALATVAVAAGATSIVAGNVTDVRSWIDQRYGAWTTNRRPVSPRKYKLGFNETLGVWEYHDGSTWVSLAAVNLSGSNVSGTLPINKGGTAATTALAALNNLGIYIQSTQPAYAANRVWIKTPA